MKRIHVLNERYDGERHDLKREIYYFKIEDIALIINLNKTKLLEIDRCKGASVSEAFALFNYRSS